MKAQEQANRAIAVKVVGWGCGGFLLLTLLLVGSCTYYFATHPEAGKAVQPTQPRSPSIKDVVLANALKQLDGMFGKGRYEVLGSEVGIVDREAVNVNYPMMVVVSIRFQDPYGYLKRVVQFAAYENGSVMMLTDPSLLYRG